MTDKPQFIARKFQNAQRLAAKGYHCPLCDEKFQAGPKLWAHAKLEHQQALEVTGAVGETELRKQFLQDATEKTHKGLRKVSGENAPAISKRSSNDNDSMQPNIGEEVRSRSSQRQSPTPHSAQDDEKRIDDLSKLTLSQGHTRGSSYDSPRSPTSQYNPLKRGVGVDAGQPDFAEGNQDFSRSRARRAKAQSGGPYTSHVSDVIRGRPATNEPRSVRASLGSGRRLFDPNLDNPIASTVTRTNQDSEVAIPVHRNNDPKANVNRPRKVPVTSIGDYPSFGFIQDHPIEQQPPIRIFKAHHDSMDVDVDHGVIKEARATAAPTQEDDLGQDHELDPEPVLLLQPETRPISLDQLVVEVKGIYAGLVLVESKCIDVDEKQSKAAQEKDPSRQTRLTDEQWQALIHLHKTLLHEHHDFFLASQHPSASPALSKLAAKYSMPARMWRHGIHAFLEVLRHRLPESLDHMLAFIYIAYSMMALLYETVSTFEDTWIECLGDLGRYRMAIEDDDQRDRDVWSGVARFWYSKAADKSPNTGRLYHHLAILARPYTLQQLSFYTRSLTCVTPFESARSSIMTLFNPIINGKESAYHRSTSMETMLIKAHGLLFCKKPVDQFEAIVDQLNHGLLDNYIGRVTSKFKEQGVFAIVANISALFEYGVVAQDGLPRSVFRLAYEDVRQRKQNEAEASSPPNKDGSFNIKDPKRHSGQMELQSQRSSPNDLATIDLESSQAMIACASRLTFSTLSISLQRLGDKNVWPLVHVSFVFIWSLTMVDKAMTYVERDIPWSEICSFLTNLAKPEVMTARVRSDTFLQPEGVGRPLPEEIVIRGQPYSQWYFPDTRFRDAMIDDEERTLELPSMAAPRAERILWLGMRIASSNRFIVYDEKSNTFKVAKHASRQLDASTQIFPSNCGDRMVDVALYETDLVSRPLRQSSGDASIKPSDSSVGSGQQQLLTSEMKVQDMSTRNAALRQSSNLSDTANDIEGTSMAENSHTALQKDAAPVVNSMSANVGSIEKLNEDGLDVTATD